MVGSTANTLASAKTSMPTAGEEGNRPRLVPDEVMADYEWPAETVPRIPESNPYEDWIRACKGGDPACSNFEYSGPFTEWALTGNIALRYDKKLEWDAKNMLVTNLSEANRYVTRTYRDG